MNEEVTSPPQDPGEGQRSTEVLLSAEVFDG
ncbi:ATP-binding protein, partial [Streptomyces sp. SID8455]|nr:ATP-binding protein [Streptomyces sp. SID8455]